MIFEALEKNNQSKCWILDGKKNVIVVPEVIGWVMSNNQILP